MITSVAASEEVKAQDVNLCQKHRIVIYGINQKAEACHKSLGTGRQRG